MSPVKRPVHLTGTGTELKVAAPPDDQWWCECEDRKPHVHCPWGGRHIHAVGPEGGP